MLRSDLIYWLQQQNFHNGDAEVCIRTRDSFGDKTEITFEVEDMYIEVKDTIIDLG